MAMPLKKKATLIIILGAVFYFILSYHIIIIKEGVRLLKKSTFTLEYTIFSAKGKSNKTIMAIDILREDGIGELLKEEGLMSEEEEILILETLDIEGYIPDQPY
ncbi:MAG TPA: hypothetical protein VMW42_12205 [Desulfatiglandales bacterium]|nr:hypothetical protein [Desulfatiglandales bacterium]